MWITITLNTSRSGLDLTFSQEALKKETGTFWNAVAGEPVLQRNRIRRHQGGLYREVTVELECFVYYQPVWDMQLGEAKGA